MLSSIGTYLARYLSEPRDQLGLGASRPGLLAGSLEDGDVLLVEGTSRVSSAIKYLTQSSWSHAAICVGNRINRFNEHGEALVLVEADLVEGVRQHRINHPRTSASSAPLRDSVPLDSS